MEVRSLYLELIKRSLTRAIAPESYLMIQPRKGTLKRALYAPLAALLATAGLTVARLPLKVRRRGPDIHTQGETMVGMPRLDNLQQCIVDVLGRGVPGDLIEAGVWRGGAAILMRAVLKAYGDRERTVWAADSFKGLPKPNAAEYPADEGNEFWKIDLFSVDLEAVKRNFARYDLLDEQVRFLVGWFKDTLPTAPIERLAVIRVDGDTYESTSDAVSNLYPRLSPGATSS